MKIAIPIFPGFTALDVVGPYEVLSRLPEAEVTFVARTPAPVGNDAGSLGLVADASFAQVGACDVLLVPGGRGTRALLDDVELLAWLRAAHDSAQWTASVCTGSLLLAAAGLLAGVEATTHWLELETLARYGAKPVSKRVVRAGRILTGAGVSAGIDLALTLAAELAGTQVAQAIQLSIEYDPQPPFDAGSPAKAPVEVVELCRAAAAARQAGGRTD